MTLHYIRDHYLPEITDPDSYEYSAVRSVWTMYHLLRCMGWTWLWECHGQTDDPHGVPDGDMAASGVTSWTAIGTAVPSKDTTTKHQNAQSLKIESKALNDGVESATFAGITGGYEYKLMIWAANDSGAAWNVDVDNGGGYANVGTIPDNSGVWTKYIFSYTPSGTTNKFKVYDNNNTQSIINIDDAHSFLNIFEYNYDQIGTDGDVQNGDEFHSASYSFVAGDINKTVVFYDPINSNNTGAYTIGAVSAGNAVLNLRVGGAETLTNTAVGNLSWRLVAPITKGPQIGVSNYANATEGSGFGLQSPHSSGWRMFWRAKLVTGAGTKNWHIWTAPIDSEFSVVSGMFTNGPSVFGGRFKKYLWAETQVSMMTGGLTISVGGHRFYAMIAADGSFLAWAGRPETGVLTVSMYGMLGILSDDPEYTERERFFEFCKGTTGGTYEQSLANQAQAFGNNGMCGTETDLMYNARIAGMSTVTYLPVTDTDSRNNPYSSRAWIYPLIALRGWDNTGPYGEMVLDREDALFGSRSNLTQWGTFDSHGYLHLTNGIIWKWSGISVL